MGTGRIVPLIVSLCLAAVLLFVSMGQMLFPSLPFPEIIDADNTPLGFALFQLILAVPILIIGRRFFFGGIKSLFRGHPNMDTLVALSSLASLLYSVAMTAMIPSNPHNAHSLYYESAAVIVALVSLGKYLEDKSKERTKDSIEKLMSLTPDTAILVGENNAQKEVPTSSVSVGDTVFVKHGAKVPLDGTVVGGSGTVNEAMLTGESLPVEKSVGSEVIGGSVAVGGALYVTVTRIGEDTTLSKIVKFVEDAQNKKAPISKTADKVAGVFVPVVIAVSVLSALIWLLCGADFSFAVRIFTSVLVIACPCAMGLATPMAIMVGTGLGASKGILVRNGETLEAAHKTSVVVFDKTGTLTEGKMSVSDIAAADSAMLLSVAYSLEYLSDHPVSKAITARAEQSFAERFEVELFESRAGLGLVGKAPDGDEIAAGNRALMNLLGVELSDYSGEIDRLLSEGKTAVIVEKSKKILGVIAVSDTIKESARPTVERLRKMGIKTVMLTGDSRAAADFIGEKVGVDEIIAEVLPTMKADAVMKYQQVGKTVMMVGDGINDAPALTRADIGCAVGSGSDIAIESAGIVLMKSDPSDVAKAIRLSRLTIRNIKQNLFWAFCYNTLGIPIAAGILYPFFGILLSPMIGAAAMSLSSLFVVTNALRLRGKRL